MKSFVAIALFGIISVAVAHPFTDEQIKKVQEHIKACIVETKVDPEVVGKLKAGDFSSNDEKAQCFTLCFLQKSGLMDANANQNESVIIEKLSVDKDKTKVKALFDKCKNEKGSSPCETAFNVYKCYRAAGAF